MLGQFRPYLVLPPVKLTGLTYNLLENLMLTKQESLKLISSIAVRGKRLDADIQEVCLSAVFYSVRYNDVDISKKLIECLHTGARKQAIVDFLEKFGKMEYKGNTMKYRQSAETFTIPGEGEGEFEQCDVADCYENEAMTAFYMATIRSHWTAFRPENIKSGFDELDFAKKFINRMEKELKLGNVKHPELYDGMALAFNAFMEAQDMEILQQAAEQEKVEE